MRGLSPRERLLVSFVIAAVIGTLFYLFVYVPKNEQLARLGRDLQQKQGELQRLQALAQGREAKELEFRRLSEQIRAVENRLPPEREIPNLIRTLQDVARELGIKLTLLRPGPTQAAGGPAAPTPARPPGQPAPPPAQPPYQLYRLDLGFEGTYADLTAYMGRLENFPRFIVLRQVTIVPGELPRLKVTMVANTFVLPREQPAQP